MQIAHSTQPVGMICALICAVLLTSSCNSRAKARAKTPAPIFSQDYPDDKYKADRTSYEGLTDSAKKQTTRNKIVLGCMRAIDLRHYWMEQDLLNSRSSTGLAFDVAKLGGAALGTVSNGARGKSIISAVLAGVVGTQIAVDKNWFQNQGINALISAMRAGRARVKDAILANLAKSDDDYPLDLAESSVLDYYIAGTLTGGLQELHEQASISSKSNQAAQKQTIATLNTVSDEDLKFAQNLRSWLARQRVSPTDSELSRVYDALVKASLVAAGADTVLKKLDAIELTFQKSIQKDSGMTPESFRKAIATLI